MLVSSGGLLQCLSAVEDYCNPQLVGGSCDALCVRLSALPTTKMKGLLVDTA